MLSVTSARAACRLVGPIRRGAALQRSAAAGKPLPLARLSVAAQHTVATTATSVPCATAPSVTTAVSGRVALCRASRHWTAAALVLLCCSASDPRSARVVTAPALASSSLAATQ